MRMALYCDFMTEEIRPLQLVVRLNPGEADWSRPLYVPLSGPFARFEPEEYGDLIGVSVLLEDLLLPEEQKRDGASSHQGSPYIPMQLGLNLPRIAGRHPDVDASLLIIQIADAEEVLELKWTSWLTFRLLRLDQTF